MAMGGCIENVELETKHEGDQSGSGGRSRLVKGSLTGAYERVRQ